MAADDDKRQSARPAPRHGLGREIALALALKLLLLYGLWALFFSQPQLAKMSAGMDPSRVAAAVVAAPANPAAKP
jgi:hypothetical protein